VNISQAGISSKIVSLGQVSPLLNGEAVRMMLIEERIEDLAIYRHYRVDEISFHLAIEQSDVQNCQMRYWLENLPANLNLYSFGIQFQALENLRAYLRNGYFSWDGSYYVQPEQIKKDGFVPKLEQGYAMTQLLPQDGTGSLVIGFERHERFQHRFSFNRQTTPFSLMIETLWDCADLRDNRAESETLLVFEHSQVEDALREWAKQVAQAAPIAPRLSTPAISGWCSWYNLYGAIHEENILEHLHATAKIARQEKLSMWVFQIDDGFTPEMGDWLDVKPQFPRGMKPLLDDIRAEGFRPGLWIAPFMVGNRSRLYAEHPDWVVKERQTGKPLAHMRFYAEFRWHKRSEEYYILDTSHPDALDYLRQVFRTWRHEWGCEYFKTDFMHFGSEYGPEQAQWHQSGLSRIQIWRHVSEMIREEIGDAIWLGCGFPLWAAVGLVDGLRIGRDVGVEWAGNYSAQSLLRDQASRNFANHILWQADPDCILIRECFHNLSEIEVESLALYAGMSGGLVMTSDKLDELSEKRLNLWKFLLNSEKSICHYPLLGQSPLIHQIDAEGKAETIAHEPVIVQVRTALHYNDLLAVFILNTGEKAVQRSYKLETLGISPPCFGYDWLEQQPFAEPVEFIHLSLQPHAGRLIFLSNRPIESPPPHLP
jgi:alpha-galactosidase